MPEALHKVGSIRVHCLSALETGFSGAAEEGQNKSDVIMQLCRKHLPAMLQEAFDKTTLPHAKQLLCLDNLHLNLGALTADEFIPRLKEALAKKLQVRPLVWVDEPQHFFALLAAYLENGTAPWNSLDFTPARWAAKLHALLDDAPRRGKLLALVRGRPLLLRRLHCLLLGLGIGREEVKEALHKSAEQRDAEISPTSVATTEVFVNNAGLVLLTPFLSTFFRKLGLLGEGKGFVQKVAQASAAWVLHAILRPGQARVEGEMPLAKCLCGLPPLEPAPPPETEVFESASREAPVMLHSVIHHWKGLGAATPDSLIRDFLSRDGILRLGEEQHLHVEAKPKDRALYTLPWALSILQTPWMDKPLRVFWP